MIILSPRRDLTHCTRYRGSGAATLLIIHWVYYIRVWFLERGTEVNFVVWLQMFIAICLMRYLYMNMLLSPSTRCDITYCCFKYAIACVDHEKHVCCKGRIASWNNVRFTLSRLSVVREVKTERYVPSIYDSTSFGFSLCHHRMPILSRCEIVIRTFTVTLSGASRCE